MWDAPTCSREWSGCWDAALHPWGGRCTLGISIVPMPLGCTLHLQLPGAGKQGVKQGSVPIPTLCGTAPCSLHGDYMGILPFLWG